MKLVIQTQIRENYAAHNGFDGEYYWKMKGGNTYVVKDLSSKHVNKILDNGIPTLTKLIEHRDDYFEEYILGWSIVGDDETPWDEWETPVEFHWVGDRWFARRTTENDENHYMARDILRHHESWIPQEGGERGHYESLYQVRDTGVWMTHKEYTDYQELVA